MRFAKWHFKKNVKQAELEAFLQNSTSVREKAQIEVDGVRISAAKRERWQKRLKTKSHEELQLSARDSEIFVETLSIGQHKEKSSDDPFPSITDKSSTHLPSSLSPEIIGLRPSHRGSVFAAIQPPSSLLSKSASANASPLTLPPKMISPVACAEPHVNKKNGSPQSLINFPRSPSPASRGEEPLLYRLFSALNLAPPDEIKLFYQSAFATKRNLRDTETISNEEFLELSKHGGERSWECTEMFVHSPMCEFSRKRTARSAFKTPDIDFICPSQVAVSASSLSGELYPFPRHENPNLETGSLVSLDDENWRIRLQEGKKKVKKLETCFPGDHPGVVASNYDLAVAYLRLEYYGAAKKLFDRILPILVQTHGSNSRYVVTVKLFLSEAMLHLGRHSEANHLAQEVHTADIEIIDVPYGRRWLWILADSFAYFGDFKKDEELLRKSVQMRLVASGPIDVKTLAAIRRLSDSMMNSKGMMKVRNYSELHSSSIKIRMDYQSRRNAASFEGLLLCSLNRRSSRKVD